MAKIVRERMRSLTIKVTVASTQNFYTTKMYLLPRNSHTFSNRLRRRVSRTKTPRQHERQLAWDVDVEQVRSDAMSMFAMVPGRIISNKIRIRKDCLGMGC